MLLEPIGQMSKCMVNDVYSPQSGTAMMFKSWFAIFGTCHFVEATDLPAKMWDFWDYCSLLCILPLCLGWTLLPTPSSCGGKPIWFYLKLWYLLLFTKESLLVPSELQGTWRMCSGVIFSWWCQRVHACILTIILWGIFV